MMSTAQMFHESSVMKFSRCFVFYSPIRKNRDGPAI